MFNRTIESCVRDATRSTILVSMVTTLQPDNQSRNQAKQTYAETNFWPEPMVQIHRCSQAGCTDQQIKIRQTLIDWFGHPHVVPLFVNIRNHCPMPSDNSPANARARPHGPAGRTAGTMYIFDSKGVFRLALACAEEPQEPRQNRFRKPVDIEVRIDRNWPVT